MQNQITNVAICILADVMPVLLLAMTLYMGLTIALCAMSYVFPPVEVLFRSAKAKSLPFLALVGAVVAFRW